MENLGEVIDGLNLFGDENSDSKQLKLEELLLLPELDPAQHAALVHDIDSHLKEGCGEYIQEIGAGDETLTKEEVKRCEKNLELAANENKADISLIHKGKDNKDTAAGYLVRRRFSEDDFIEMRIAVVGNVDAGKSTLLGVLTHGELDNGRGKCRKMIFRHKHEAESGRTSSVAMDILGFDSKGNVTNKPAHDYSLNWVQICSESSKVLTFIDLAGHEKYLKTTVFGFTGHAPHFAMLMIGANMGIVGMTKEHLRLALALNVPVYIVVTKVDMCPPTVLEETMTLLMKILKSPGCRKVPMLVSSEDDVVVCASNFVSERICPIFQVSNVTGQNLDLLRNFLNLLNPRQEPNLDKPCEFQIDDTFNVPGVGTVVSGTVMCGRVGMNDTLLLGPDGHGEFTPVSIKGIHRRRMPTGEARGGQTASLALKKVKRSAIRKGMVLVSPLAEPKAVWEFEAEIRVLHHPTTIGVKYQAMLHCGVVRQTAFIKKMEMENIRTGDKTKAIFRFIKNPEYLHEGVNVVFREGQTKAVGKLIRLIYDEPGGPTSFRSKARMERGERQQKNPNGNHHQRRNRKHRNRDSNKSNNENTNTDNNSNNSNKNNSNSKIENQHNNSGSAAATALIAANSSKTTKD